MILVDGNRWVVKEPLFIVALKKIHTVYTMNSSELNAHQLSAKNISPNGSQ